MSDKRYYVWANESCDNSTESLEEARRIVQKFLDEGAKWAYIVDEEGSLPEEPYGILPSLLW